MRSVLGAIKIVGLLSTALLGGCGGVDEQAYLPKPDACYNSVSVASLPGAYGILNGTPDTSCKYRSVLFVHLRTNGGEPSQCTATLIAPNIALSAAHCFVDTPVVTTSTIMLGANNVNVGVTKMVPHPDYVPESDTGTGRSDLAILFLEKTINLPIVKLSSSIPTVGRRVVNVGYGLDGQGDDNGSAGARLVGNQLIQSGYGTGRNSADYPDAIVTVAETNNQQSCPGDSGGPLFFADQLVGVLSGGDYSSSSNSCRSSINSAFTPVAPYLGWIKQKTGVSAY